MASLRADFERMALALFVAYRALMTNETPVACVFADARTGQVLSWGRNDTNKLLNGTRHAEFLGIDDIMATFSDTQRADADYVRAYFANVVLYVTVEPCIMCGLALKQLGIGRVVYGAANDRFGGNGTVLGVHNDRLLRSSDNYPSFGGLMRTEAIQLLRNFYIQENDTAPEPKAKKNRDIDRKPYPPGLRYRDYMLREAFLGYFGAERASYYEADVNECEITPDETGCYTVGELVSAETVRRLPRWPALYEDEPDDELVAVDVERFVLLFYDVRGHRVDYGKDVATVADLAEAEHKRRRVES